MGTGYKGNNIEFKAVDFFCGAGGVTCGFEQAGIDVLVGIDKDRACQKTYLKNNKAEFLEADISELDKKKLTDGYGVEKNDDNLIFIGCSPCQYYTNLKTDKTKSKDSRLLLEDFQNFVSHFLPGYVFIENVSGLNKQPDSPLGKFRKFLKGSGYNFDDGVINAKYYGVPQNRRRYVLLASRVGTDINIPEGDDKLTTVEDAIGNYTEFPPVEAGYKDESNFMHTVASLSDINLRRIKKVSKDGGSRLEFADDEELQLECYKNHNGHTDVYGRMNWGKPSPAITTKFRYTSSGRYGHPEQNRGLSIREGATLQSFPKNYVFHCDSVGPIGKMIGNAVPPELAKRIGNALKE